MAGLGMRSCWPPYFSRRRQHLLNHALSTPAPKLPRRWTTLGPASPATAERLAQ